MGVASNLVETPTTAPFDCIVIPGCAGPFAEIEGFGPVSRTGLVALCEAFGFHPEETEGLKAQLATALARAEEAEAELSKHKLAAKRIALVDRRVALSVELGEIDAAIVG